MTLTPVRTEIFKTDNPDFNWRAAYNTYDAVMRMEPEEADLFAKMVVFDVVHEDIIKNYHLIQAHLNKVVDSQIATARQAIVKRFRAEGASPELEEMAKAVEQLAKADWDPKLHPRNERGQFTFKIRVSDKFKPLSAKKEERAGIKRYQARLSPEQRSRYQQEYMQVANLLEAAQNAGYKDPKLLLQNRYTGQVSEKPHQGTHVKGDEWDPRTEHVVGVRMAHSGELSAHGAAFDLMTSMGTQPNTGDVVGAGVAGAAGGLSQFSDKWYQTQDQSTHPYLYNRVGAGSQFLGQIAPYSSKAQTASTLGRIVGEHGTEAEKVFGPPTRKAMYRYRGTERKMNPEKLEAVEHLQQAAIARGDDPRGATFSFYLKDLAEKVPSRKYTKLQLASGVTPPSEGVMIDRNGKATAQAIGYGDDHYLPFNLKNLKALKGGEYIRTRSVGGPTAEDIYTGMLAGADRLTVVSRSGVFTVNFRDDFRGGRRYNQKAHRMISRYERLLDALNSEKVERNAISPEERFSIQEEVEKEGVLDPAGVQREVQRRVNERMSTNMLTTKERQSFENEWVSIAHQHDLDPESDEARYRRAELFNRYLENKQRNWSLNGPGYAAALESLREQFPYYIKGIDYEPRVEGLKEPTLSRDSGYVEHTRNRPTAAKGRFHSLAAGGDEHHASAAEMDYQAGGAPVHPQKTDEERDKAQAAGGEAAAGGPVTGGGAPPSSKAAEEEYAQKALVVRNLLRDSPMVNNETFGPLLPGLTDSDDDFLKQLREGDGRKAWNDAVQQQSSALQAVPGFMKAHSDMERAAGKFGQPTYDPKVHRLEVGPYPYSFSEEDLNRASLDQLTSMLDNQYRSTFHNVTFAEMDDADLKRELETAIRYRQTTRRAMDEISDDPIAQRHAVENATNASVGHHQLVTGSIREGSTRPFDTYLDFLQLMRAKKMREGDRVVPPKAPPDQLEKTLSSSQSLWLDQLDRLVQLERQLLSP